MTPTQRAAEVASSRLRAGDARTAEAVCRRAIGAGGSSAELWDLLGSACQQQGKLAESLACFQEALRLKPDYVRSHNHLGILLSTAGRHAEAAAHFREAIRYRPDYAEAHNNLGSVLRETGRLEEAAGAFAESVRLRPDFTEGHNNLGVVLLSQERHSEAAESFRRALEVRPGFADARKNLGIALRNLGRADEAIACFREVVRLRPDFAAAYFSLGLAYMDQHRTDEAIAAYRAGLRLRPDFAEGHNNLGSLLLELGRVPEGLAEFNTSLRLKPDYEAAHWNRAMLLLLRGDFENGWIEYEWRRRLKKTQWATPRQPFWDGSDLGGKTILLHTEQGLGDTIQFARYAPLVKDRCRRVVVVCPPSLVRLLRGCEGIDEVVGLGASLPAFDVYAPLMSLPGIFQTVESTIPAKVPYLSADAGLVESWRRELTDYAGFRIGIAWQGDPKYPGDRNRSVPLRHFEPVARVPGVRLVSLQKGAGTGQLAGLADHWPVLDWSDRLDEEVGAFADTAALMKSLDLVISSDTAVAHLAGALGVRTWVALGRVPDWRWQLDRDDSPWYPTMRLFRQSRIGDWKAVFEHMAADLRQFTAAPA